MQHDPADLTGRTAPVEVTINPSVIGLRLGIVFVQDMTIAPSDSSFALWSTEQIASVVRTGMAGGESRREAVRAMIRAGGFKPAGRNKPAQEYLLRTVTESGTLPAILNAVDVLNVISLCSGLPISLLAMARVGSRLVVRYGERGEKFVFNRSGQELEIEGLICACGANEQSLQPLGTPIKDSMLGKVTETDRDAMAVMYAPAAGIESGELASWVRQLAAAFQRASPESKTSTLVNG